MFQQIGILEWFRKYHVTEDREEWLIDRQTDREETNKDFYRFPYYYTYLFFPHIINNYG